MLPTRQERELLFSAGKMGDLAAYSIAHVEFFYVHRIQGRACVVSTKKFESKNERGLYLFMFWCLTNVVLGWRLRLKIAMVCIHTYVHTHIHTHTHTNTRTHIYIYTYIHTKYKFVCMYTYICIYICIYMYVCI